MKTGMAISVITYKWVAISDFREFNTIIPRNVRISEAPSHGKPVLLYDHRSSGARAYMSLVKEICEKERRVIAI